MDLTVGRWTERFRIDGSGGRDPAASLGKPNGDVAQLAEHLLCKQGVVGSIPIVSTKSRFGIKISEIGHPSEGDRCRVTDVE